MLQKPFIFRLVKILSLVAVLLLDTASESRAACVGATATAAGIDEEGAYCGSWNCGADGSNVTCTLSKGTLTISGDGEMRDYEQSGIWTCETCYPRMFNLNTPWAGKEVTKAVVEGNVTKIGQFAFAGETYLTEISGMENITSIGRSAFNRTNLTSIDIPNVTELDRGAFYKTENLQYISFRDDVVLFNNNWFEEDGVFFNVAVVQNSCSISNGYKTCGTCDGYTKRGTGCVTSCGNGYRADETTKQCIKVCQNGQVEYKGQCYDEYPFAKKRWTPAEANEWLKDDDNFVIITFKK